MLKAFGLQRSTNAVAGEVTGVHTLSTHGSLPASPGLEDDDKDIKEAPSIHDTEAAPAAVPQPDAQQGVKNVEAVTLGWSKKTLVCVYINMWCLYAVNAFQGSITGNLAPFILSGFDSHSLIPVIYIVSSSINAALYFPVAKVLDIFGRPQGFASMVALATLGTILMATTKSVSTYAAANVFYSVGYGGMIYTIDVITSDTSKLQHRGLAFALTSSPYMITSLAGPKMAEKFWEGTWRWAYGTWAILLPIVATPLFCILVVHKKRAEKAGLIVREPSGRTTVESLKHYFIEFDAVGVIALATGLVLFLLPFSLADAAPKQWASGYIIALLVVGFAILVFFGVWEARLAPKALLPYKYLVSRHIAGTVLLNMTYQISYYAWNSYFSSFLQVVKNLSISEAGYVGGIFDIVSGVLLFLVGFGIKKSGYFKWLLLLAVPLQVLSLGLMIHWRTPTSHLGLIIMTQVFMALSGSTMIICQQVSIMATSDHQHIAALLALLSTSGWLGGSIGSTISGAIWTNTFPKALERLLPEESLEFLSDIYGDLTTQLSYPIGDATRTAIQEAYAYSQKRMLITATCFMGLALFWVLLIRNVSVKGSTQTKGTLF